MSVRVNRLFLLRYNSLYNLDVYVIIYYQVHNRIVTSVANVQRVYEAATGIY